MSLREPEILQTLKTTLKHENFKLVNYSLKPLQADGIMGEYYHLLCTVQEEIDPIPKEYKFFVKIKPPHAKAIGKAICDNVFRKELSAYRMFTTINLPSLNAAVPACFYSDDRHLVLGDLLVQGYEMQTTKRVAIDEEINVVIKSMAGMHASGIVYEELQTAMNPDQDPVRLGSKFPEVFPEVYYSWKYMFAIAYHKALVKGLDTAIKVFKLPEVLSTGKLLKDEIKRFWVFWDLETGLKPSKKYRNAMCHCDLWPPNIFIRYGKDGKPEHAKIIDFQIERYLPPALDVIHYLLLNTTREYRQKNLLKWKKVYYDYFSKVLEEYEINPLEIYTLEEFLESFKEVEMFAIWSQMHTIPIGYKSNIDVVEASRMINEDRGPLFQECVNDDYRRLRVRDCLLEMVDYFENN